MSIVLAPAWLKVNDEDVCFGARDESYGEFTLQYSGKIMSFALAHLRGKVTCHVGGSSSFWGCREGPELRTFLTSKKNKVIFPQTSGIQGYRLPGVRSDSSRLIFNNLSVPLKVTRGQQFRIWYDEDLRNNSEKDNGGRTCMDIHALYI